MFLNKLLVPFLRIDADTQYDGAFEILLLVSEIASLGSAAWGHVFRVKIKGNVFFTPKRTKFDLFPVLIQGGKVGGFVSFFYFFGCHKIY